MNIMSEYYFPEFSESNYLKQDFSTIVSKSTYPDFPIPGVNFIDLFPILDKFFPEDFNSWVSTTNVSFKDTTVLLPESRAFLFYQYFRSLGCKVLPLRKAKLVNGEFQSKLPPPIEVIPIKTEYSSDYLCYTTNHPTTKNLIYFDDVCATGQSAKAVVEHFKSKGFDFSFIMFYLIIEACNGKSLLDSLNIPIYSVHNI